MLAVSKGKKTPRRQAEAIDILNHPPRLLKPTRIGARRHVQIAAEPRPTPTAYPGDGIRVAARFALYWR
jgi:hypothetical protein